MSSKKNKRDTRQKVETMPSTKITMPEPVNPLAAQEEEAEAETPSDETSEDLGESEELPTEADSDSEPEDTEETAGNVGPLGGGIHPSEWDPDSEPVDRFSDDSDARPIIPPSPVNPQDKVEEPELPVEKAGPTGVNKLGHPVDLDTTRDPKHGFYKGLDASGKPLYRE